MKEDQTLAGGIIFTDFQLLNPELLVAKEHYPHKLTPFFQFKKLGSL